MLRSICLISILLWSSSAHSEGLGYDKSFLTADVGLSIFGEAAHREYLARSFSCTARYGSRWGQWGAFLQVEPAFWIAADGVEDTVWTGVLNLGVGGEYLYADGFVRTSLSAGPSILLTGTDLDEPGQTGVFFEIRPTGLRWHLKDDWVIGVDPILLSLAIPFLKAFPS